MSDEAERGRASTNKPTRIPEDLRRPSEESEAGSAYHAHPGFIAINK
jgi:hypothetical protein